MMFSTTLAAASLVLVGNAAAMSLPGLRGGGSSSELVRNDNDQRNDNDNDRSLTSEEQAYESSCYPILLATSNDKQQIDRTHFYYFADAMSNGYFSYINGDINGDGVDQDSDQGYSSLPITVKYSFVTLSCLCHKMGGRQDCCADERAKLDVTGVDPNGPPPNRDQRLYLNDICRTTSDSIGDKVLPPTGELPVQTPGPTNSPTNAPTTSPAPTQSNGNIVTPPSPVTTTPAENEKSTSSTLSGGAWAAIAIGAAAVGTMLLYTFTRKDSRDNDARDLNDQDLETMDNDADLKKKKGGSSLRVGTAAAATAGVVDGTGPPSPANSHDDTTATMAMSSTQLSSVPSAGDSISTNPHGHMVLPAPLLGRPDDESHLSDDESHMTMSTFDEQQQNQQQQPKSTSLAAMGMASSAVARGDFNDHGVVTDDDSSIASASVSSSVLMENALASNNNTNNNNNNNSALPPQTDTPGELDQAIETGNWEAVAASAAAAAETTTSSP